MDFSGLSQIFGQPQNFNPWNPFSSNPVPDNIYGDAGIGGMVGPKYSNPSSLSFGAAKDTPVMPGSTGTGYQEVPRQTEQQNPFGLSQQDVQALRNKMFDAYNQAAQSRLAAAQIPVPQMQNGLLRPGNALLAGGIGALLQGLAGRFGGPVGQEFAQNVQQGQQQRANVANQNAVQQYQQQRSVADAQTANALQQAQLAGGQLSAAQQAWLEQYKADTGLYGKQYTANKRFEGVQDTNQTRKAISDDQVWGRLTGQETMALAHAKDASQRLLIAQSLRNPDGSLRFDPSTDAGRAALVKIAEPGSDEVLNRAKAQTENEIRSNKVALVGALGKRATAYANLADAKTDWLPAEAQAKIAQAYSSANALQQNAGTNALNAQSLARYRDVLGGVDALKAQREPLRVQISSLNEQLAMHNLDPDDPLGPKGLSDPNDPNSPTNAQLLGSLRTRMDQIGKEGSLLSSSTHRYLSSLDKIRDDAIAQARKAGRADVIPQILKNYQNAKNGIPPTP